MTKNPRHRSFPIRLANACGNLLVKTRALNADLNSEALLATATRGTGLEDFGSDDFREPLDLLTQSYRSEAELNFIGRMSARTYLLQLLTNRLLMERDRSQHSEIADQQITAPVFILGLPRTGSTLLFELMALNSALRAPMSWEVMLPSPPPQARTFTHDPRINQAQRMLDWVDRIAPDFKHIHEVGATRPQECIPMMTQAFRSIQFYTTNNVPTYQAWLNNADLRPAYAYHRQMLQQFQAFGPRGTWLLKAPGHLFGIEEIFRVYPDARIVQTHRDPVKVIGSIASHCVSLRQAFSEHLDLEIIGSTWCWLWAMGLERTLKFRRAHPELADRFLDVQYADFVRQPIKIIKELHDEMELPCDSNTQATMEAHLAANPKGKHGVHRYQLEDFGLSAEHVWTQFDEYNGTFTAERPVTVPEFVVP